MLASAKKIMEARKFKRHGFNPARDLPAYVAAPATSRFHGDFCFACLHWEICVKSKKIPQNSDYCHFPGKSFEPVTQAERWRRLRNG